MADKTLHALTAKTTPADTDELMGVQDPFGADDDFKITYLNLKNSLKEVRVLGLQVFASDADCATGDAVAFFRIPSQLNGYVLSAVAANVYAAGTTGTLDVQVRNVTDSVDMLSTKLTIDSAETDSSTATAAVIDAAADDVATGDKIAIDVDAIHTTPAKGLWVELQFSLA